MSDENKSGMVSGMSLYQPSNREARRLRDQYLRENGHNMKGIGELGSSSDSSDCSGFHNCRYGIKSIEKPNKKARNLSIKDSKRKPAMALSFSMPQLDARRQSNQETSGGMSIFSTENYRRIIKE